MDIILHIIIITYLNLFYFCSYIYSNGYYEIGEQFLWQKSVTLNYICKQMYE